MVSSKSIRLYGHTAAVHNKTVPLASVPLTLAKKICRTYHQLCQLKSLEPNDQVNSLFTKLVTTCTFQYDTATVSTIFSHKDIITLIPHLRVMASLGEYNLELSFAQDFVKQQFYKIHQFKYYKNYQDLVNLEMHALLGAGATLDEIVFIGSGPLPLSPILIAQSLPQSNIHNVDRDCTSIEISNALITKLGLDSNITQHLSEATEYSGFGTADVVILGALVGENEVEKMDFLKVMGDKMKSGSFIMVRSAHSLRRLLYPSIEPFQVDRCGFETVLAVHPYNEVVNSVLIAKKN